MRNAQPDAPGFKWVALCVPLVLTACGGGDGTDVAGTPTGGTAAGPKSAAGVGTGIAAGVERAGSASTAAAGVASQPSAAEAGAQPKGASGVARNKVTTPAEIAAQRELERDRPAPVVRGTSTGSLQPSGAASAAAVAAAQPPNSVGLWSAPTTWPLNGLHAVLTPDGKVMNYGSDRDGLQDARLYYDVWTPSTNSHSLLTQSTGTDIFCSAQLLLPAGQVLLAGGDTRGIDPTRVNYGVPDVNFFDPATGLISRGPPMSYARWYGSVIPLADRRVLAAGGIDGNGVGSSVPEIYTPGQGWKSLPGIEGWPTDFFYPRGFLAPNGRVIIVGDNRIFSIDTEAPSKTQIGTLPKTINWMMPWAMFDRGKVFLVAEDGSAMVLDINGSTPVVTSVAGPGPNRIWSTGTVLADGKMVVTGGSAVSNELVGTAFTAMIWDPKANQWTVGAAAQNPRLYHSTALLLPDATVLSAGGGSPGPVINLNAEVYSPPYLFDSTGQPAARPIINTAPAQVTLGAAFGITVASSKPIQKITLVRMGSVTHSNNFGQRFLELPFTQAAGDPNVDIQITETPNILPVGHYMLFAIDSAGVPSVAKIVKVDASWTQVAQQGQSLTLPSTTLVQYGAGGNMVAKSFSGTVSCQNEFFGTNPSPTVAKGCSVLSPLASGVTLGTATPTSDSTIAAEGGAFNMATATVVSYGAGTRWIEKLVTGAGTCSNTFFGSDPAPFSLKSCVTDTGTAAPPPAPPPPPPPPPAPPPSNGVTLAVEGGTFTVATATVVSYGADTRWVQKTVTGTGSCTNGFFGTDPAPFTVKSCVAPAGTPAPAPAG